MITTTDNMQANDILVQFWKDHGISQAAAAMQLDVSESLVSHLVKGRRRVTWETYAKFYHNYCRPSSPFYLKDAVTTVIDIGNAIAEREELQAQA